MSRIINQNTEPLFIFDMPDDHLLSETISVKGEKGEKGDPTKLSDLENDEGFITAGTDALTNYYDKTAADDLLDTKLDKTTFNAYEIPSDFFTGDETVSGTGSNITLSNTGEAVFKSVVVKGDTVQDGTPTPSTPVDVEVATGSQTIEITGASTQSYTLDLGDIKLCKLGNYQDRIYNDGDKWYIHKETGYAQVDSLTDGSSYSIDSSSTNTARVLINACLGEQAIYTPTDARAAAKCSHFIFMTNWNTDAVGFFTDTNAALTKNGLCFRAPKTLIGTTATEVEEWLGANPLDIYYVLAAATDNIITDKALIAQLNAIKNAKSNNGTTTIIVSGNAPAILSIEAFKSTWGGSTSGINNALDQKADKYALAQRAYYCDSVAEMKKANLELGSCAVTTGYYAYGDGGGAQYRIVSDNTLTDDGATVHALDNGLKAVMIINDNTINVKQFGAKGDGTTDDTVAIQKALAWNGDKASRVIFERGATFIAQGKIYIYSNTDINLNGATLKDANGVTVSTSVNNLEFLNNVASLTTAGYGAIANFNVHDGTLDGNTGGVMFCLLHAQNCRFENIDFNNAFVATHVFDLGGCKNITIKNCNFIGCLMSVADNAYREVIQPDYATYGALPYWGQDDTIAYDALPTDGLIVEGCVFKKNDGDTYYLNGVGTHAVNSTAHNNITVRNCEFYGCEYANIRLPRVTNLLVENNTFYGVRNDRTGDHFAIDLVQLSSSQPIVVSKNITIRDNHYISTLETDDQVFMQIKGYDNDNAMSNVLIQNNTYNGVSVSEDDYIGQDFMHTGRISGLTLENNKINKCKHVIFKTANLPIDNLKIIGNICDNCLRPIRCGGAYATDNTGKNVDGLVVSNNIWRTPRGSIDTSSFRVVLGLSENVTVASGDNKQVPLEVLDGLDIYHDSAYAFTVPNYVRKFKLSGHLSIKTDGGKLIKTRIINWDRIASTNVTPLDKYQQLSSDSDWVSVDVGEYIYEDKDIFLNMGGGERAWRDGRYCLAVRLYSTSDIMLDAETTKIILEGW